MGHHLIVIIFWLLVSHDYYPEIVYNYYPEISGKMFLCILFCIQVSYDL